MWQGFSITKQRVLNMNQVDKAISNIKQVGKEYVESVTEIVTLCSECHHEVNENTYSCGNGWDGFSSCSYCGIVEGETYEVTQKEYEEMI